MKNKKNKVAIYIIIVLIAGGGAYALKSKLKPALPPPDNSFVSAVPDTVKSGYVLLNVPFTSQAPTGDWADPRQEDGCEEASVLMAWLWIQNQSITPVEAEKTIIDMSSFELAHYGNYQDFDAEDTARFMKDYYGYQKVLAKINPTIEDIKNELRQGNLVLVPANGQKLGNPHYKHPGPLTHMLVIKGFDDSKGIFITNDSGTKYGNNYVYNYQTVYDAMVDYPSGSHGSQEGRPKAMISVSK